MFNGREYGELMSSRKLPVALVMAAAAAIVVALALAESGPQDRAGPTSSTLALSPATGGKHARFVVAVIGQRASGVFGPTRRSYIVAAQAVRPASACVNNRETVLSGKPAGARLQGTLDPARGEGGPSGWCPGTFDGTVIYSEAYACQPTGRCRPPKGFVSRTRVIARFSFQVR